MGDLGVLVRSLGRPVSGSLLLVFALWAKSAFTQELAEMAAQAHGASTTAETSPDPSPSSPRRRQPRPDRRPECETSLDESLEDVVAKSVFWTLTSPFWLPAQLADGDANHSRLLSRPFKNNQLSNIAYAPASHRKQTWAGRLMTEYQLDFSDAEAFQGQLQIESLAGWGVDTSAAYRFDLAALPDQPLWTGDVNVTYRFAFTETVQFRTGLGCNWLNDPIESELGFNFTYQIDAFLRQPWIWSSELDLGRIGSAGLLHYRTTIGAHINHLEPYLGYDHYQIGSAHLDSMVAGFRIWF